MTDVKKDSRDVDDRLTQIAVDIAAIANRTRDDAIARAEKAEAERDRLRTALRRVAVELGGYEVDGDRVLRCLYCAPSDDACLACRIHTLLGDEEYMGKGGVVTEHGGLVEVTS